jgi:hypothetical protein
MSAPWLRRRLGAAPAATASWEAWPYLRIDEVVWSARVNRWVGLTSAHLPIKEWGASRCAPGLDERYRLRR